MKKLLAGLLIALSLALVPASLTAAPPHVSGGTIALVMVTDNNSNSLPNWGDTVTFTVTAPGVAEPHLDLKCSQRNVVVYSATTGYYSSYPWPWTKNMTLSSASWTSGAASCVATLYWFNGRKTPTLATLSFTASA